MVKIEIDMEKNNSIVLLWLSAHGSKSFPIINHPNLGLEQLDIDSASLNLQI